MMRGWAVMTLLTACYAPTPPSGAPCGPGEACPGGQFCVVGRCSTSPGSGGTDDAMIPDEDAAIDALVVVPADAPNDAPPVPPVMRFGDRNGATADTLFDIFLEDEVNTGIHPDLHFKSDASGPTIVRIDVTSVPTYATVTSARLSFYVSSGDFPMGTDIDVFLMNESWTEGDKIYDPGIANETDRNPGEAWSTSGARPPSRGGTAIATTTVPALLDVGDELSITIPPATVQAWIATPATNYGIAIVVDGVGFYAEVRSAEAGEAAERPMLELMLE
jgi:hypothetical protein